MKRMDTSTKIRFGFIAVLWLLLCYLVVASTPQFTLWTVFTLVASGIIVWVPLYKKYVKNGKRDEGR